MTTSRIAGISKTFVTAAMALLVRCGVLRFQVIVLWQYGGWNHLGLSSILGHDFSSGILHSHSLNFELRICLDDFIASIYTGITLHVGALCILDGPVLYFFLRSKTLLIFGGITGALCSYGLEGCYRVWMDDLRLCLDQCLLMPFLWKIHAL